jgi:hypothetical protein
MADGPTVVTSGNGGTAVAVIIAIIALAIVLFATGVIDFEGGVDRNVNVDVNTPAVETPSASEPAAPAPEAPAPAAPAPAAPAPANGG